MITQRAEFKRMVLGLPQSGKDFAAVSATAKLAELLGLDLLATCIEDSTLIDVAGLPFVRELRPFGNGWRPIEAAMMKQELERAAETTRRLFAEAVRPQGIAVSFRHERGSAAAFITSVAQAHDIVVIVEPQNPGALAAAVRQMVVRRDEWPRWGARGAAYIRRYFLRARKAEQYLEILRSVVK